MKVLISALACEPGRGSEHEVGFRTILAAASIHEVWVITASESIAAVQEALLGDPRASRVHLEGIEFGASTEQIVDLNSLGYHWRYDRWQRNTAARGLALEERIDFDVIHHVTLASYWTRVGVAIIAKPLVWGPIGGGVNPPLRLLSELGSVGIARAVARAMVRPAMAMLPPVKTTQRSAAVILAQNPETGRRLRGSGKMKLLSNATAVEVDGIGQFGPRTAELFYVGRLVSSKAPMLALRTLRYVANPKAELRFFGEGPERSRLERSARNWGVLDRVRFEGWIPRRRLLPLIGQAGVLIHTAVHEEAGLCIAEALTLGTPVVALDHGGPSQIIGQWEGPSALIAASGPDDTARNMATAIDRFLIEAPAVRVDPLLGRTSFAAEVLRAYEVAAAS
jgi:glycosyltransferase involved in cell wall biosynthesis